MNEKKYHKIIDAAYGSAGLIDRLMVWYYTKKSTEANELFQKYKRTACGVKSLKQDECPDDILNSALLEASRLGKRKHKFNFADIFLSKGFAFGSVVMIVSAITLSVYYQRNKSADEVYSREQIELAEKQTREALAIVGKVLNNSKTILKDEVLYKQVSKPINVSIRTVNYLFKKGEKYESIN